LLWLRTLALLIESWMLWIHCQFVIPQLRDCLTLSASHAPCMVVGHWTRIRGTSPPLNTDESDYDSIADDFLLCVALSRQKISLGRRGSLSECHITSNWQHCSMLASEAKFWMRESDKCRKSKSEFSSLQSCHPRLIERHITGYICLSTSRIAPLSRSRACDSSGIARINNRVRLSRCLPGFQWCWGWSLR
jgi:hypothetical protein